MQTLRRPPLDETRKKARHELQSAISSVQFSEEELRADIRAIAGEVKRSHKTKMREHLDNLLISSRSKRKRLSTLAKHRRTLQQQYDALDSVELNEKVMNSVKQTSSALKALGLESKLSEIDETMMDLHECTDAVEGISDALQGSVAGDISVDDDELEKEMRILLCDDDDPTNIDAEHEQKAVEKNRLQPPHTRNTTELETIEEAEVPYRKALAE
jgi:uncharacterized protein (DUF3084 family)